MIEAREQYAIEKELAVRLKTATRQERRVLYPAVYDEFLQRVPHHLRASERRDPATLARDDAIQVKLLRRYLDSNTVFLEIGPGDFKVTNAVAKWCKQVYALDVTRVRLSETALRDNVRFVLSDGVRVPVPGESITLAYSNDVIEHLHPDDAYEHFCNVRAALARGGSYICITPSRVAGPHDISRNFEDVPQGLHLKEYSSAELADLFRAAGFSQVNTFLSYAGYVFSPLLPAGGFRSLELLLEKLPAALRKKMVWLSLIKVVGTKL